MYDEPSPARAARAANSAEAADAAGLIQGLAGAGAAVAQEIAPPAADDTPAR
jgi:hypothetical protein